MPDCCKGIVFLVFLALVVAPVVLLAQVRLDILPESQFQIEGRSNQSDWAVRSTKISGWIELDDPTDPLSVTALSLIVPTNDIKSEKGLIMDRIMHGALDVEQYPDISFELRSVKKPEQATETLNLTAVGVLTLTGSSNEIPVELLADFNESGMLQYSGTLPLTMSDYGMTPPTAMFGRLRVHRDIKIRINLLFGELSDQ